MTERQAAPEGAAQSAPADGAGVTPRRAAVLAVLGLVWLVGVLWAGRNTIGEGSADDLATVQAAIVLPTLVAAAALASAAAALLATVAGPLAARSAPLRALAGALAGTLVGLAAAGAVPAWYQGRPMVATVAVTIGLGACVAGLLAALASVVPAGAGARGVPAGAGASGVAAGLVGALAVLVVGFLRGAFEGRLVATISSGSSLGADLRATLWIEYAVSLLSGLAAGAVAHWYLRRHPTTRRQLPYAVAGALPGALLLVAEGAVRFAGARLLDTASGTSVFDTAVLDYLANGRLNHCLVVFFAGALTALVLLGRSLGSRVS